MKIAVEELHHVMDYAAYSAEMKALVDAGKTSGPDQSEAMVNYTKLNMARMNRGEKTLQVSEAAAEKLRDARPMTWLTISEVWCGDASQNLPMIEKMAATNPNIKHKIILRDEHPGIMDHFLTNGGRAIPIVIFIDDATGEVKGHWGPRPSTPQQMVMDYKKNPSKPKDAFYADVHLWYSQNKGQQLQEEFLAKLQESGLLTPVMAG